MPGLIGRKVGMTRVFSEEGLAIPVTVLKAGPCTVVQIKSPRSDGYAAVQVGFGERKHKRSTMAELGHAAKAGLDKNAEETAFFKEVWGWQRAFAGSAVPFWAGAQTSNANLGQAFAKSLQ